MALTVDLAWYGNRERDIRNGFSIPPNYSAKQMFEGKEEKILIIMSILISTTSSEETGLDLGLSLQPGLQLRSDQQTRPSHQPRLLHQ